MTPFSDPLNFYDPDGRDAIPAGGGSYNFQVNPKHYGASSLSEVFRLMNGRHVNHPKRGYSGQCATGAQAMTGNYGKDGLWRDAAPGSLKNWFQGPAVSSGGVSPGTMIAKGWPGGHYGGANGHTGIYIGGNKMFAQNGDGRAPNGRPFVEQDIDPSEYFEVRSKTPYDKDPTKCSTP